MSDPKKNPASPGPDDAPTGPAPGSLTARFPALRNLRLGRRRQIPFIQQTAGTDCGPACLSMILGYHGKQVKLDEVREAIGLSRFGTDAFTLVEAAPTGVASMR